LIRVRGTNPPVAIYNREAMKARGTPPEDHGLGAELDRLYRLPLAEFTGARNELAKRSGKRSAEIKALAKPPVAAWAVNQLYWQRRPEYDALVDAAQQLRSRLRSPRCSRS
jgi:hypothetical protein